MCGSTCSCKAGSDGACKHVAAVALKLNNIADAKSSTDMPQMWGRPASKPNTSKKESIEELFGEYKPVYIGGKQPNEQPPSFILKHFPDIDCVMLSTLKLQQQEEAMWAVRDTLEDLVSKAALNANLCMVKDVLNWNYSLPLYALKEACTLSADEVQFFSTKVEITELQAEIIAAETITQGKWHQERSSRISSSIAHRILCRKRSFESLAEQLEKAKRFYSPATDYGIAMEPVARQVLERKAGTTVTQAHVVLQPVTEGSPILARESRSMRLSLLVELGQPASECCILALTLPPPLESRLGFPELQKMGIHRVRRAVLS
ncbi:hypothetical protein HPB49_008422 [Dermacentor silvarum]|uniref:Uncharacterized protein n=1 Tax=Dermacentor silvarum TaxID=543639 RepID=A0ACB8C8A6_DERSI|nr:hypothetical protein HPB49_008422 [Dermacentor silvarum]